MMQISLSCPAAKATGWNEAGIKKVEDVDPSIRATCDLQPSGIPLSRKPNSCGYRISIK
ncbi:predicted protein [Sclerotinia sclerotiorum 1980 UF-70]|uniref:Uncharacterized protein n=1 Tax=Sclerotinia sclerotiorum (strain ATCC 18683 / 1980 / Ss-1) TaxID=665079 RepID=A7F7K8_SCLS1|nr:predicted protein [Sclerotinia sclerotiorum 1980 UF-70]EDN98729.1 predicted protein [Sclerotinia sclerotiorum 1980 UF-70]